MEAEGCIFLPDLLLKNAVLQGRAKEGKVVQDISLYQHSCNFKNDALNKLIKSGNLHPLMLASISSLSYFSVSVTCKFCFQLTFHDSHVYEHLKSQKK